MWITSRSLRTIQLTDRVLARQRADACGRVWLGIMATIITTSKAFP